jgi:hypothetical protein
MGWDEMGPDHKRRSKRLGVPEEEGLVERVDVGNRGARGDLRLVRVPTGLDDGAVGVVERRLEELGLLALWQRGERRHARRELLGRGRRLVNHADVRLGAHELDGEAREEAEGAVRPRERIEELWVRLGRHLVPHRVRVDELVCAYARCHEPMSQQKGTTRRKSRTNEPQGRRRRTRAASSCRRLGAPGADSALACVCARARRRLRRVCGGG